MPRFRSALPSLILLLVLALSGCPGNEPTPDVPPPEKPEEPDGLDLDGDGRPDPLDGDLDEDGLSNRLEIEIGTNPIVADTDGDKYDDSYEYTTNPRMDPSLPFHPLIADIPQIHVEIVQRPAFYLTTTEGESESESITITEGETIDRSSSSSYNESRSLGHSASLSQAYELSSSLDLSVASFGAELGLKSTTSFGYNFSTNETYSLSSSETESIGRSLQEARQSTLSTSRTISGGQIVSTIRLYNAGNIAVNVQNIAVAYANMHSNGSISQSVSMLYDGNPLGFAFTLPPGGTSSPLSYHADFAGADAAFAMAEDIARAGSVQIIADSMHLTNETGGNYTDVYTNLRSRSARVLIDPGPNFRVGEHGSIFDKHIVATPRVNPAYLAGDHGLEPFVNLTLADVLELLGVTYATGSREMNGEEVHGITSVNGVDEDLESDSFWLVALETRRNGVNGTMYFAPFWSYDPANIEVIPGETVQLVYSEDRDGDGVPARIEIAAGSSDDSMDSDEDGVGDALEIFGWCFVEGTPVMAALDGELNSAGACAEADAEVWFTNPMQADTDGDGVSDRDDDAPLERPRFETAGVELVSLVHNRGGGEPAAPAPGAEPTPPAFELRFDSTHLEADPADGLEGAFVGGSVATTEPFGDAVIREESVQWRVETAQRAEAIFLARPQGGTRIALTRDPADPQGKRFMSGFEQVATNLGRAQAWHVEVLPEAAAVECGFVVDYKPGCAYETYRVTFDSAPGVPRAYVDAALNDDSIDSNTPWPFNHYSGDANRYERVLRDERDGWAVRPRFVDATDGRIEAAFFVMCESAEQLDTLHAQAFSAPVSDLTTWTASGSSLLDGVSGCRWSHYQATAPLPTDGAYDWQWPESGALHADKRRHTYSTRLYTVGRGLDGRYVYETIDRTFKSTDPPRMKLTAWRDSIPEHYAKRRGGICTTEPWCDDEPDARFRAKPRIYIGNVEGVPDQWLWKFSEPKPTMSSTNEQKYVASDTPWDQMEAGDEAFRMARGDGCHLDANFKDAFLGCDQTRDMWWEDWAGGGRDWSYTYEELGVPGTFKGGKDIYIRVALEFNECVTDWRVWFEMKFRVEWEALPD